MPGKPLLKADKLLTTVEGAKHTLPKRTNKADVDIADVSQELEYQALLQRTQTERYEEVRAVAAQGAVSRSTGDKLVPIEKILRDMHGRPSIDFIPIAPKISGINAGFVGATTIRDVQTVGGITIQRSETGTAKKVEPGSKRTLPLRDEITHQHMVKPYDSKDTIREYLSGPLYKTLLTNCTPTIGLIKHEGQFHINSQFLDTFTDLAHSTARLPQPAQGFEKVVVASAMLGELDPNPGNIGLIHTADGERVVKIDHGRSLLHFSGNIEDFLYNLELSFFARPSHRTPDYMPYIEMGILTFNLDTFRDEIQSACGKLDRDLIKDMIASRIQALEEQGVNFNMILSKTDYFYRPAFKGSEPQGELDIASIHTPQELIDFYANSIMNQAQIMQTLSQDLTLMSSHFSEHDKRAMTPRQIIDTLRVMHGIPPHDIIPFSPPHAPVSMNNEGTPDTISSLPPSHTPVSMSNEAIPNPMDSNKIPAVASDKASTPSQAASWTKKILAAATEQSPSKINTR